jgi:hypothetical protein
VLREAAFLARQTDRRIEGRSPSGSTIR